MKWNPNKFIKIDEGGGFI